MKQNTFVTIAAGLVIFASGYALGYFSGDATGEVVAKAGEQLSVAADTAGAFVDGQIDSEPTPVVENGDAIAFTINVENIPESQRAFLKVMGITGNEIVVTNTMLACAQAEIGIDRMVEIQNGATPSTSEGLKLAGCY